MQPLKLENLRTAVPDSQLSSLLAPAMSSCWECTKRSLLEGEAPWKSRGNLSIMGKQSHSASIPVIDSAREEGKGREQLPGGPGNISCPWDWGCSCTLTQLEQSKEPLIDF